MEHDENAPLELAIDPVQARKAEHDSRDRDRNREAPPSPLPNATSARGPILRQGKGTAVRSFRIGTVLSESISLLFQHGIPLLGLFVAAQVPLIALTVVLIGMAGPSPNIAVPLSLVQIVAASFLATVIVIKTLRAMQRRPVGVMEAIRLALHQPLARTAGLALLYFLGVIAAGLLATLLIVLARKLSPGPQGLAIGYVLAAVGFVAVASQLWLLLPVVVAESTPLGACFRRSAALIKGYHLPITGLVLIPLLIFGAWFALFPNVEVGETGPLTLVFLVLVPLSMVFASICSTVSYTELRAIQEGVELEDIRIGTDEGAAYTRHRAGHAEPFGPAPAESRSSLSMLVVILTVLLAIGYLFGQYRSDSYGARVVQEIQAHYADSPFLAMDRVECPEGIRANSGSFTCTGFVQGFTIPVEVTTEEAGWMQVNSRFGVSQLPPQFVERKLQEIGKERLKKNRTFDCGSAPMAITPSTSHVCRCTNGRGEARIEVLADGQITLNMKI